MLYQLSYTHHLPAARASVDIVTCPPEGDANGYPSALSRPSATAFAWSLDGPGWGTKAVPR